ncbi:MAG: NAD(P)-dependent oxidoreductase [Prevotellaceae bacterium]|nr:NAD(P)-dependent oxidoreductase [Prevotellaceae bacterium]
MSKILITGASGFIGSFIVEEALRKGFDVWAAMRKSSSKSYLTDSRINFIEMNLADKQSLVSLFEKNKFDYIVHAAGVTKCSKAEDFYKVNTLGLVNLVSALQETAMPIKRFVFISSLSVCGPVRENRPYTDITIDDKHAPDTLYGISKDKAEEFLVSQKDFPSIILRPTGVYGPREKDYFLMAKSIKQHVDFAVGFKPQSLTFVFVQDLVNAVFLALDKGTLRKGYFVSDGKTYSSRTFSDLIRKELGNPWLLRITAPIWMLRLLSKGGQLIGQITGKMPVLNNDKFNIMKQRNWQCDIRPTIEELGYKPEFPLEKGVPIAMKWYKDNGWI